MKTKEIEIKGLKNTEDVFDCNNKDDTRWYDFEDMIVNILQQQ